MTAPVLMEVFDERCRQDEKWGEQNHPDLNPDVRGWLPAQVAYFHGLSSAGVAKHATDSSAAVGKCSWTAIAVEELAEAVEAAAGGDTGALRNELVQLAAVCVSWVQAIDRRSDR